MNDVKINIRLNVDGKDSLVGATLNAKEMQKALNGTKDSVTKLRESFITFNQGIEIFRNLTGAVSQFCNVLNSATADAQSFSQAMAAANTMAGKDAAGFAQLKDEVAELSKTIPVARDQLANGLYQVISNGVPEDNWVSFLEKSAKASVGGLANLEEVVKVTSTVIKNYGLEWSAAQEIQDKIQLTAKNGVTSFEQLAQALPRVTGNASTLGVTIDELMATFSTLTGVSGNTAEVSTQLAAIFTALVKPSSEATEMAQKMGIQFDAASIKAAGGMRQFLTQLDAAVAQYSKNHKVLSEEVYGKLFGSAESLRALGPLTGNLADTFAKNVDNMRGSAGTIEEAFDTIGETGAAKSQLLANKLGAISDAIYEKVGPALPLLNMSSQIGETITSVGVLALSLKGLGITSAMSGLLGWSRMENIALKMLTATSLTTRAGFTALRVATIALYGAMSLGLTLAISGVIELLSHLIGKGEEAKDKVGELKEEWGKYQAEAEKATHTEEIKNLKILQSQIQKAKEGSAERLAFINRAARALGLNIDAAATLKGKEDMVNDAIRERIRLLQIAAKAEFYTKKAVESEEEERETIIGAVGNRKIINPDGTMRDATLGELRQKFQEVPLAQRDARYYNAKVKIDTKSKLTDRLNSQAEYYTGQQVKGEAATQSPQKDPVPPHHALADEFAKDKNKNKNNNKHEYDGTNLIENAETYKELGNNIQYYQKQLEKTNPADKERIKLLAGLKEKSEKAQEAISMMIEEAGVSATPKTIEEYDKAISLLEKKRGSATKENLSTIDAQIKDLQQEREALESTRIATLKPEDIKSYDELGEKISYVEDQIKKADDKSRTFWERQREGLRELEEEKAIRERLNALGPKANDHERQKFIDGLFGMKEKIQVDFEAGKISEKDAEQQMNQLQQMFRDLGIDIPVNLDTSNVDNDFTKNLSSAFDGLTGVMQAFNQEVDGSVASITKWASQTLSAVASCVAAFIALAGAKSAASAAETPIVGWIMAAGAAVGVIAALSSVCKFADGGLVSGPTLGLIGEYPGASSNPEVIAPLDKLKRMIQPQQVSMAPGTILGKIRGRDIVLVAGNESQIGAKSGRRTNILG